ncbi:Crp/Fnr family transcriptional regulator [Flavobacterium adhaerens]|uniref:Crp/Fnr family transcriptional regulator n=1 Tax=Flavobacterium adhaerens TaxID=3149043 RepID=UPI0032B33D2D
MEKENIKANTILIKENQKSNKIYFIESGLLRTYFLLDGKEITTYFACDTQLISVYASFLTQKPFFECLETIEDCVLYSITYESVTDLYSVNPNFESLGKILAEQNYLCLIERTYYLQAMQAKEKYRYSSKNMIKK